MSECPFFIDPYEGDSDMYVSTLRRSKTKAAIAPLTAQESFDMKMMMQAFSFVDKNNPFVPKSDLDTLTETNRLLNLECEELKGDVEKLRQAFGILKTMTIQERGWRLEDSDIGNCEFKESIENLTYKIDSLLDK